MARQRMMVMGVLLLMTFLLVCPAASQSTTPDETSTTEDTEFASLVHHLDSDDVKEDEPGFLRQIRKYSRRLWHINCSARRRRYCHCYSRQLRQYFCCDCDAGPCFPGTSLVTTSQGVVSMSNLSVGHIVLAGDGEGHVVESRVLGFLDKRPHEEAVYTILQTRSGRRVTLSGNHLIFASPENVSVLPSYEPIAASRVQPGYLLLTLQSAPNISVHQLRPDPVVSVNYVLNTGAYVPLTEHGTLLVDEALASCYASFPHELAHWALYPARLAPSLLLDSEHSQHQHGVRLFPKLLKVVGRALLPSDLMGLDPAQRVLKFDLSQLD